MVNKVNDLWYQWYDNLSRRGKVRYQLNKYWSRITDYLLDYDWIPEFIYSDNVDRFFCFICQHHEWEVLWQGIVHKDKEACLLCGKIRSLYANHY